MHSICYIKKHKILLRLNPNKITFVLKSLILKILAIKTQVLKTLDLKKQHPYHRKSGYSLCLSSRETTSTK